MLQKPIHGQLELCVEYRSKTMKEPITGTVRADIESTVSITAQLRKKWLTLRWYKKLLIAAVPLIAAGFVTEFGAYLFQLARSACG